MTAEIGRADGGWVVRRRRAATAAVFLGAIALLIQVLGAGSQARSRHVDPGARARHGGAMVVGILEEPATLNPYIVANGVVDRTIVNSVIDPLLSIGPDGTAIPVLAARVPTLANGGVRLIGASMRVTFDIRPGAAWSDGVVLGCRDVAFTWQTVMDDRWVVGSRHGWDQIEDIRCPTPRRAVVDFVRPYAGFVGLFTAPILPRHALVDADFDKAWLAEIPIGSGPFIFERWRRGVSVTVRRNPGYWNAGAARLPYLDHIEYRFFTDPNTLAVELSTGTIDMIGRPLTAPLRAEHATFPGARILATPSLGVQGISFNHDRIRDRRIRQAIAYTIDRRELVAVALQEPFQLYDSMLVAELEAYRSSPWSHYRPDPEQRSRLLQEAGYQRDDAGRWMRGGRQLRVTIKSIADRSARMQVTQLIQQQLERSGIGADLVLESPQVFFGQTLRTGSWDLAFWGIGAALDPVQRTMLHCEPSPGRSNAARYCNRCVSELIDTAETHIDGPERVAIVRDVQALVAADLPVLPLTQERWETVLGADARNVSPSPSPDGLGWDAEHWWVAA